MLCVPLLMITHVAFYLLARPQPKAFGFALALERPLEIGFARARRGTSAAYQADSTADS